MCEHKETIEVSKLRYCKDCNKYMGEVRELNPLIKEFFEKCCQMERNVMGVEK